VGPSAAQEDPWIGWYLVESDGRLVKRDEEAHERLIMKKMPGYGEGDA